MKKLYTIYYSITYKSLIWNHLNIHSNELWYSFKVEFYEVICETLLGWL